MEKWLNDNGIYEVDYYLRAFDSKRYEELTNYIIDRINKHYKKKEIVRIIRKLKVKGRSKIIKLKKEDILKELVKEYSPVISMSHMPRDNACIIFWGNDYKKYYECQLYCDDVCKDFYEKRMKKRLNIINWRETKRTHMGLGKK